jgi:hypothetical protein
MGMRLAAKEQKEHKRPDRAAPIPFSLRSLRSFAAIPLRHFPSL